MNKSQPVLANRSFRPSLQLSQMRCTKQLGKDIMISRLQSKSKRIQRGCKMLTKMIVMLKVAVIIAATFSFNYVSAQMPHDDKVLIVYLSRTNNTKAIAEIIPG